MQIMSKVENILVELRNEVKAELLAGKGIGVHKKYNDLVHKEYYEVTKVFIIKENKFYVKFCVTKTPSYTIVTSINDMFKDMFDESESELFYEVVSKQNIKVDTSEELEYYKNIVKQLERKLNGEPDEEDGDEEEDY